MNIESKLYEWDFVELVMVNRDYIYAGLVYQCGKATAAFRNDDDDVKLSHCDAATGLWTMPEQ